MDNLIKPSQYAKEYGISRQAVYAKIKKGALTSKEVNGQIYIDMSIENRPLEPIAQSQPSAQAGHKVLNTNLYNEYRTVLASKNETIETLRHRIDDLKESNEQMTSVLRGEIDLLKQAFNEMRSIYSSQLLPSSQNLPAIMPETVMTVESESYNEDNRHWITIDTYLNKFSINPKYYSDIKEYVYTICENGDSRVKLIDGDVMLNEHIADLDFAREALS